MRHHFPVGPNEPIPGDELRAGRTVCLKCNGTGALIVYFLSWEEPGPEGPIKRNFRCFSQEEADAKMAELGDQVEVNDSTGARTCSCLSPKQAAPATERAPGAAVADRKTVSAGDHE